MDEQSGAIGRFTFLGFELTVMLMAAIKVGLIGGSGLGEALGSQTEGKRHEIETPFGKPSDAIIETEWAGLPVLVLSRHGPGHLLNPTQVPYRANIFALKQLGCTHILASGAVGSLREEFKPRDLVIADQVIDKTTKRAGTFYEKAAVHVEFAEPFCPVLRKILLEAGAAGDKSESAFAVHDRGCYVAMEGPAFSTRAESLMHRLWGGDLIGMTAMPEAKLAREAEISYALIALVTDYDCWRHGAETTAAAPVDPFALLQEIISHLRSASENGIKLMRKAVELIAARPEALAGCPAQHALKLAIWSQKNQIDPAEVQRLAPLWMKYFE
jgi:5'-methylthioadenosine phosphorylase